MLLWGGGGDCTHDAAGAVLQLQRAVTSWQAIPVACGFISKFALSQHILCTHL
jgi:hypothetical protein